MANQSSVDVRCDHKQVYTYSAARRIAKQMNRRDETGEPVKAYHCNTHHGWHVGGIWKFE